MLITRRAEQRCQEPRISTEQLEWLLCYGQVSHSRGVCLRFFDRSGFSQLLGDVDPTGHELAFRSRNIYAVERDNRVIAAGYRDERLKSQKPNKRIRRNIPSNPAARRIHHRTR